MSGIALLIRRSIGPVVAACVIGSCGGPVQPDDTVWQDVRSFSWPAEIGSTMRYKVNSREFLIDTTDVVVRAGKLEQDGRSMFRLNTTSVRMPDGSPVHNQLHFLPTRDTLFTQNGLFHENGLKATYALVSPLERGQSWIASYSEATDSATVRATVIERYSSWKLEGKTYTNVVAVKYEDISTPYRTNEWIRFYAQGVGVILTVKNVYPASTNPESAPPLEFDRTTLLESSHS